MKDLTRQLYIVHLSDIHFGTKHRFNPPISAAGDSPGEEDYPTLLGKLAEDLDGKDPDCPVIVCITGDLVETAKLEEFEQAENFVQELARTPLLGKVRGSESIFLVPGNHDVSFNNRDIGVRWQQWTDFSNRFTGESTRRESPWDFVKLHDRIEDLGVVVLCLNSSIYVEEGKPDEQRGRIDIKQLDKVKAALDSFDPQKLASAIRIALIHHHPVLIPALVEPGRGYDAIHKSGLLLTMLRQYGFHAVFHGHKHHPHTFTHDVDAGYQLVPQPVIMIAAGGSVGSIDLPNAPRARNCYNRVVVKWHPKARQSRIRIETRGLSTFNPDGTEELPTRWRWDTLKVDDRSFLWGESKPTPGELSCRPFDEKTDRHLNEERSREYERTRGNLPVVEVIPSLVPGQAYEARAWIVHHDKDAGKRTDSDYPTEVTWTAGPKFPLVTIKRVDDPLFCAIFNYWGPTLIQACLRFQDGEVQRVYAYARMPIDYSKSRRE